MYQYKDKQIVEEEIRNRLYWFKIMSKLGKVTMSQDKAIESIFDNQLAILIGLSYLINKGEK